MSTEGRICPVQYRYPPEALDRVADVEVETLYVIGGLYGNRPALDAIVRMSEQEPGPVSLVFNGDFNWFNIDLNGFEAVNKHVFQHLALRGNVETELADPTDGAGCGCAYPAQVSDVEVDRSNEILRKLQQTAQVYPWIRKRLNALPMHLVAAVGDVRIGVVHGDSESLAGWNFSEHALAQPEQRSWIQEAFNRANVQLFASTHTCLPVAQAFTLHRGRGVIFNNGAAGMPNFRGTRYGLITRVSVRRAERISPIYGTSLDGVHVDALPVHYDDPAWRRRFFSNWPPGSAAFKSYFRRIMLGPEYELDRAVREGITWKDPSDVRLDSLSPVACPPSLRSGPSLISKTRPGTTDGAATSQVSDR